MKKSFEKKKKSSMSESEKLEYEAKLMEERLKLLQDRIQQQKLEDESVLKPGGSRWASARVDKGSVLKYGKQIDQNYQNLKKVNGGGDPIFWNSSQLKKKPSSKSLSISSDSQPLHQGEESVSLSSNSKVHWSELEPITNRNVNRDSTNSFVNSADSEGIDEEAERRAFQEAILAWRKGATENSTNETIKIEYENQSASQMWVNPFDKSSSDDVQSNLSNQKIHNMSKEGNSLADGVLDEEAERAEFQRAVEAWRNQGKVSNTSTSSSKKEVDISTNKTLSGKELAENLARVLDLDKDLILQSFQSRIKEASEKLSESNKLIQEKDIKSIEIQDFQDEDEGSKDVKSPINSTKLSDIDQLLVVHNIPDVSICSSSPLANSQGKISLVETILGYSNIECENYIVEEVDD